MAGVAPSRLDDGPHWTTDAHDRVRHARGQSLPDWIALRSGRLGPIPDAVARPTIGRRTSGRSWTTPRPAAPALIPYGGGTSVVGGVTTRPGDRPVVSVDLAGTAGLRSLDETSGLATFGAGTTGPAIEAALAPTGRTLGHYPQSFERSTVGGWVVTRSAGQESTGYGRIEALFAGGHLETPGGPLDLPPHPGVGGRAGPAPARPRLGGPARDPDRRRRPDDPDRRRRSATNAFVMRDWDRRWRSPAPWPSDACRCRWSGSRRRSRRPRRSRWPARAASQTMLRRYLGLRGVGPDQERCLVLVGLSGRTAIVDAAAGEVARAVRELRGVGTPGVGTAWRRDRFRAPYLRNTLWAAGYAVDTLETATDWTTLPDLAAAVGRTLRHGLDDLDERVHAFSHLSHVYPTGSSLYTTYVFRLAADPDETLERWRRLKRAASEVIAAHGATISHQHGVGADHAPYLAAEKGPLGMGVLESVVGPLRPGRADGPGRPAAGRAARERRPGPRHRRRDAERPGARLRPDRHARRRWPRSRSSRTCRPARAGPSRTPSSTGARSARPAGASSPSRPSGARRSPGWP